MPSRKNNSLKDLLLEVADHLQQKQPFVIFKYPDSPSVKAIFQMDGELHKTTEFDQPGFVFGPFKNDMPVVVIRGDRSFEVPFHPSDLGSVEPAGQVQSQAGAERYRELISLAVRTIREGALKKVVLSRRLEVTTYKSAPEIFEGLISAYPSAFCYCWYHPRVGTWAGATPEILLDYSAGRFSTVALAGTIPKAGTGMPQWGKKEREEQQIVTDYIDAVLEAQGIHTGISEVTTVAAGSLWHLKTTLTGKAGEDQVAALVRSLHPTPAVCGIPLDQARSFILDHEGYPRKYYTGFLGEVHAGDNRQTRLFVNLRCMELLGSTAHVFVGGGITADSDPEKEWQETRAKSQTILKVL